MSEVARGGCRGDDERAVFDELRVIVEETVALCRAGGKRLPPDTVRRIVAAASGGAKPNSVPVSRRQQPGDI